ncbi:putative Homogentisate 1,2-dioxygenase [Glarea lozoyensis 74030]|uniref:homogentisate 1,2-dioxygenase n=1 Tax=Glarea lozoyensis (strain ATCC 74030 / MF5533) TaxID=1104152 RepID=H0ER67_GLAL7|nr:putative Homogentisate 1,2-dioxygenase [Glarea lozoyensis 74030]
MSSQKVNPEDYQKVFHWAETQQDGAVPSFALRKNDPIKLDLETTPRASNKRSWLYRVRPAVAHEGFPGEICVIQRGQRFRVELPDGPSRGYILEVWGSNFTLPELGPLGSNGLANSRDFLSPKAKYEVKKEPWEIVYKLAGKFFKSTQQHSPFDVVAWHGNYVPYKYDLTKFVNVGSISVDHIDPSIFCVLTAPSYTPGSPLADFLIFSPRWDVASHTYRPPYYHRNVASELMGLIYGSYGGRSDGFVPGSVSFECGNVPHGVAYEQFKMASANPPPEMRISEGAIAFMFESNRMFSVSEYAWTSEKRHEHEPSYSTYFYTYSNRSTLPFALSLFRI